jgi:hypothetical protein
MRWLRASHLSPAEVDDPVDWGAMAEDVRTVIRDRIARSDTFLLVWSQSAAESAWVQYEVGMAQALGKPILVVLIGGDPSKLPGDLAETQHVELDTEPA